MKLKLWVQGVEQDMEVSPEDTLSDVARRIDPEYVVYTWEMRSSKGILMEQLLRLKNFFDEQGNMKGYLADGIGPGRNAIFIMKPFGKSNEP